MIPPYRTRLLNKLENNKVFNYIKDQGFNDDLTIS